MKNKILIVFLTSFIALKSYTQTNLDSIVSELNLKVLSLQDSIEKIKTDETSLYSLKRNMLKLQKENEESHKEWWSDFFKYYGVIGFLIGGLIGFWGLKERIKSITIEKLSDITGVNQKDLKDILENKLINKKLRAENSFFILNEKDSVFTFGFVKVMRLFGVDTNNHSFLADINGLQGINKKLIEKIKKYDILIIENQSLKDGKRWEFPRFNGNFETLIKKIKESKDLAPEELEKLKNYKALVELSNEICKTTSIIYYGQAGTGNFPSDLVNSDLQHKITFANAPAQLYGNINNQLQFIHELKKN